MAATLPSIHCRLQLLGIIAWRCRSCNKTFLMNLGRHIKLLPAAMWVKQLHSLSLKRECKTHQCWSDTLQEIHAAGVVYPRAIPKAMPRTKGVYHVNMDPLLVFQGWQMRPCMHLHTSQSILHSFASLAMMSGGHLHAPARQRA